MPQENITAARFGARAGEFIRSASVLCNTIHDGWLPSTGLLLGFACELIAKRRLILSGVTESALRRPPYGHDISYMWKHETGLYSETESIALLLRENPSFNGVRANFDWGLHFDKLAESHSNAGDYSLRYHNGETHFADPKAATVVLAKIWKAEQAAALASRS